MEEKCVYEQRDGGFYCNHCGGDWGGSSPIGFAEVPPWMLRCPVCGREIGGINVDDESRVSEVSGLEEVALSMLASTRGKRRAKLFAARLLECGVPAAMGSEALDSAMSGGR